MDMKTNKTFEIEIKSSLVRPVECASRSEHASEDIKDHYSSRILSNFCKELYNSFVSCVVLIHPEIKYSKAESAYEHFLDGSIIPSNHSDDLHSISFDSNEYLVNEMDSIEKVVTFSTHGSRTLPVPTIADRYWWHFLDCSTPLILDEESYAYAMMPIELAVSDFVVDSNREDKYRGSIDVEFKLQELEQFVESSINEFLDTEHEANTHARNVTHDVNDHAYTSAMVEEPLRNDESITSTNDEPLLPKSTKLLESSSSETHFTSIPSSSLFTYSDCRSQIYEHPQAASLSIDTTPLMTLLAFMIVVFIDLYVNTVQRRYYDHKARSPLHQLLLYLQKLIQNITKFCSEMTSSFSTVPAYLAKVNLDSDTLIFIVVGYQNRFVAYVRATNFTLSWRLKVDLLKNALLSMRTWLRNKEVFKKFSLRQVQFEDEDTKMKSGMETDSSPSCKIPQDRNKVMIGSDAINEVDELFDSTMEDITPPSQTYYDYKSPIPRITASDVSAATPTKRKGDLFSPFTMSADSEEYDSDKENKPPIGSNRSRSYDVNSSALCDTVIKTSNTTSKIHEPSQFTKETSMMNNPSSNSLNSISICHDKSCDKSNLDSVTVCLEDHFNAVNVVVNDSQDIKEQKSGFHIPESGFAEMNNDQCSSFEVYEDSASETLSQGKTSVGVNGSFLHDVLHASPELKDKENSNENRTDLAKSVDVMSDDDFAPTNDPQPQDCIVEANNFDIDLNEGDVIQATSKCEIEMIDHERVLTCLDNINNQNIESSGKSEEEIDENNHDCNTCLSQSESGAKSFAPDKNRSNGTDSGSECTSISGDCSEGCSKLSFQEINKEMTDCDESCGAIETDTKIECTENQGNPEISNSCLSNANSELEIEGCPESHAAVVTVSREESLEMRGDPEVEDLNPFDNETHKNICEECSQSCEQFSTDDESKNAKKQGNHEVEDSDEEEHQEIEQCRESYAPDDETERTPISGAALEEVPTLMGDKPQTEVDQCNQEICDGHDDDIDMNQNSKGNSKVSFATTSTMKLIHGAKAAPIDNGMRSSTESLDKETLLVTKKANLVDSAASRGGNGHNSAKRKESDDNSTSNHIISTKKQVKNEFVRQTSLLFDKGKNNGVKSKVDSGLSELSKQLTSIKDRKLFWQQHHNHTNDRKNESFPKDVTEHQQTASKMKSDDDGKQNIESSGKSISLSVSNETQGRSSRSLSPCSKLQKEWVQSTKKKRQHALKPQLETIDPDEMESFHRGNSQSNTKQNFSKLMAQWSGKDNVSNSERKSNNSNMSTFVKTLTPKMTLDPGRETEKSHSSKAICFMNEFLE